MAAKSQPTRLHRLRGAMSSARDGRPPAIGGWAIEGWAIGGWAIGGWAIGGWAIRARGL